MTITYVSTTRHYYASPTHSTSESFSVDAGSGDDRGLVVDILIRTTGQPSVSSMVYNGVTGTYAVDLISSVDALQVVEQWYLPNPASGSNTLVVTFTGSGVQQLEVHAIVLNGFKQSSPLDQTNTAEVSNTPISASVTPTENNEIVIATYVTENNTVLDEDYGTTALETDNGGWCVGSAYIIQTTAAAQTMGWSGGTPLDQTTMVMGSYKEESAGGPTTITGSAALSGTGDASIEGLLQALGDGALIGAGAIATDTLVQIGADGSIVGAGDLTIDASVIVPAQADLFGAGAIATDAFVQILADGSISGTGSLTTQALIQILASGQLSGTGSLTVDALVTILAQALLTGQGDLTAIGEIVSEIVTGQASLTGAGAIATDALIQVNADGSLSNVSDLTVEGLLTVLTVAILSGSGSLVAVGTVPVEGITVTTPDERTYILRAQDRVFSVEISDRGFDVRQQDRTYEVQ